MNNLEDKFFVWNTWTDMYQYKSQYNLLTEAEGLIVTNNRDKKHIDGMSSMFNCSLGYGNNEVIRAINEQLLKMSSGTVFRTTTEPSYHLAKKLCALTNNHFKHVFFVNSGSEACDTAIKMAQQYYWNQDINKYKIISLKGCYHGSTLGALSTCTFDSDVEPFRLRLDGFVSVDTFISKDSVNEKAEVKKALDKLEECIVNEGADSIAALIFEPVQLSNEVNILPVSYLQGLKKLKEKYNFLLMSDEVATGFGRCGYMFYMEKAGFYPDIMMLAKGITSGYIPLGAVMATSEIFNAFLNLEGSYKNKLFRHGFTTSGNPIACQCALAVIDYIEKNNLIENSHKMGILLKQKISALKEKYHFISCVQGEGLLIAVILSEEYSNKFKPVELSYLLRDFLCQKGLIVYPCNDRGQAILIAPPLTIDETYCDRIVKILDGGFRKCHQILINKTGEAYYEIAAEKECKR